MPWPEETSDPHRRLLAVDADFGGPLIDAAKKGHRVQLAGPSELDGEPSWELKIHPVRGGVETWHLDRESFLPLARFSRGRDLRFERDQRSFFSDYREVEGIVVAHRLDVELDFRFREMEVEEVEINPDFEDDLFRLPPPDAMRALAGLAGAWDVAVRSRPFAQAPWSDETLAVEVRSDFFGALLVEELDLAIFGTRRRIRHSLSYDRFREVYRLVRFDTLTSHLNVLEGGLEEGRLVLTSLPGTSWTIGETTYELRVVISERTSEGFRAVWEVSSDAGASWVVLNELTYSRRSDSGS